MSEILSLAGKVAVVTGAGRGIGRAIALELARRQAAVVVNYHRSAEAARAVIAEIEAAGGRAGLFQADVSSADGAAALMDFALETFGDLHILVNNAGITRDRLLMMMSEEDWQAVLDTNLKSTFLCSKAALKHMLRKRTGRIINIASVAGQMGNPGQANYSASKAGQIGFTKALAREVASRGITVNAVAPGFIETDILQSMPAGALEAALKLVPLGRLGQPAEVAQAVAFLASDAAAYITGQVLGIDGGMAMM
ncbi:MAG: 3-oxoacyl-[acyl-carrier-protein] reductase [Anaerolineales bacterium]